MSEEAKDKGKFEFPMMPIFGVDLGERLGELSAGQKQLESALKEAKQDLKEVDARLSAKIDAVDAKLTAKIDAVDAKLTAKIDAVDAKLTAKIDAVDAKLTAKIDAVDSRVDKCQVAINRLDERMKSLDDRVNSLAEGRKTDHNLLLGILAAVIAGFVLQFFLK